MRLENRVALVTGSSRGIGRAIALAFAKEGANIILNYVSNDKAAKETFDKVKATGREVILAKVDISSKSGVDAMVSDAISKFGKLDVLVNNAGIINRDYSIHDFKESGAARLMDVNLNGPLNCIAAASKSMISNRYGKIINIISISGFVTAGRVSLAYVASKAALTAITRKLAILLGPYGINVNGIAPGTILTELQFEGRTEEEVEKFLALQKTQAALGMIGAPQDIANAAVFLASDESSFITGQVIIVDGGRMDFFSRP